MSHIQATHCCSTALEISNAFHDPINHYKNIYASNFYTKHEYLSRGLFMTAALISGIVKPLIFIITSLVAAIMLPLKGAYLGLKNQDGTIDHIKAGALNLLGFVCVATFFVVAAYHMPLAASASIYMAATVVCIVIHIKRAAEHPDDVNLPVSNTNITVASMDASAI